MTRPLICDDPTVLRKGLALLPAFVLLGIGAPAATSSSSAPQTVAHPGAIVISHGTIRSGGPEQLVADDDSYLVIESDFGPGRIRWYGKIFNVPKNIATLEVVYKGKNVPGCYQHFSIRHWGGGGGGGARWSLLDKRSVRDTEVELRFVPRGDAVDYVGGKSEDKDGPVWLKLDCQKNRQTSFEAHADWMEIAYTTP